MGAVMAMPPEIGEDPCSVHVPYVRLSRDVNGRVCLEKVRAGSHLLQGKGIRPGWIEASQLNIEREMLFFVLASSSWACQSLLALTGRPGVQGT